MAWEKLHDPAQSGHMTMEDFYDLCIAAGYSEDAAGKAASERGFYRLRAGQVM